MDSFAFVAVVSTDIIMVVCISHIAYDNESMQMHGVGSFLMLLSLPFSLSGIGRLLLLFFLFEINYSLRVLTEKGYATTSGLHNDLQLGARKLDGLNNRDARSETDTYVHSIAFFFISLDGVGWVNRYIHGAWVA